jgi:ubiquinone/menaquinone biosynthesis C-methylase UbiE
MTMSHHAHEATEIESDLGFRLMSLTFKLRDLFSPRERVLEEAGIQSGWQVLDYGCGSGSYVPAASRAVGESGKVFALDVHPLAVNEVEHIAAKQHLDNVQTIFSNCATRLPDRSIDAVLLYDTYHALDIPSRVMAEIERVLKPNGILSFSDHHMNDDDVIFEITRLEVFELVCRGKKTYTFKKRQQAPDDLVQTDTDTDTA